MKRRFECLAISILLAILAIRQADGGVSSLTPRPRPPKPVLMPPRARELLSAPRMVRAGAVVAPSLTATLYWTQPCHPLLMPFIEGLIESSTNLATWSLIRVVPITSTNLVETVPATGRYGFWRVGWRWKP